MPDTPQSADKDPSLDGIYTDPYTGEVSLPPNILEQLRKQKDELLQLQAERDAQPEAKAAADRHMQELLGKGWISDSKVAEETNLDSKVINQRISRLKPNGDYQKNGHLPTGAKGEAIVKGSELCWRHPYTHAVLLSGDYARGMIEAEKTQKALEAKNFVSQMKIAEVAKIPRQSLSRRTKTLNPNGLYLKNGQLPTGVEGEITVKGSELRWQHPYNFKVVLLSEGYAKGIIEAEDTQKKLEEKGFRLQPDVARQANIQQQTLINRTCKINPKDDYLRNGQLPVGAEGEITVKGSALRWQHPYNASLVLLSEDYAKGIIEAEEEQKALEAKKYRLQSDVAKEIKLGDTTIAARTRSIIPTGVYLKNGLIPKGDANEVTVSGSELCWRHPYNKDIVLLSEEYANGMIEAEETKRTLEAKNFVQQDKVAKQAKLTEKKLAKQSRSIESDGDYLKNGRLPTGVEGEITVKGSELRWQHPYNANLVLLSEGYAKGIIEAEDAQRKLEEKKFISPNKVAKQARFQNAHELYRRIRDLNPIGDYLKNGQLPTGAEGEITVKGSDLYWKHPYTRGNVLISEDYAKGIIEAEEKQKVLEAKKYRLQSDVAKAIKLGDTTIAARTRSIIPTGVYLKNGLIPKGDTNEVTISGSELCWRHPYDKHTVLLLDDYAQAMIEAEKQKDLLEKNRYQLQSDVIRRAGKRRKVLSRTASINPDGDYLPNGQPPKGVIGEQTVKGQMLCWKHPYDSGTVLLSEEFANAVVEDCLAAERIKVKKGAKTETLGTVSENVSADLTAALNTTEPSPEAGKVMR